MEENENLINSKYSNRKCFSCNSYNIYTNKYCINCNKEMPHFAELEQLDTPQNLNKNEQSEIREVGIRDTIKNNIDKKLKGKYLNTKWTKEKALEFGNDLIEWLLEKDENLFYQEFIYMKLRLRGNLTWDLAKKFPEFKEIMEDADRIQEVKLLKGGINRKYNYQMISLVLRAKYGYSEPIKKLDAPLNNEIKLIMPNQPPQTNTNNEVDDIEPL